MPNNTDKKEVSMCCGKTAEQASSGFPYFSCNMCSGCGNPFSPQPDESMEEWEIKLNQMIVKAWKNGVWHSEADLFKDIKFFISQELTLSHSQTIDKILGEIEGKNKSESIMCATHACDYCRGRTDVSYNQALSDMSSIIKRMK